MSGVSTSAKIRQHALSVLRAPQTLYRSVCDDPVRAKRIAKVSIALTTAMAFTLPPVFSSFHGQNPFLLGTIAIYLFPIKTVGGELVGAAVGLTGITLGIAYANFCLFLANLIQDENIDNIGVHRRVFLWCALALGAFVCGYMRSKVARSYLAINFFMVVNMFALIRGIDHFGYQFHNFFYVMVFGTCVSVFVCFAIWPEDRGGALRKDVLTGVHETKGILQQARNVMQNGASEELDIAALIKAESALAASLHEAKYELSFSRVDPEYLVPIRRCLSRVISVARVFNASMRRKNRLPDENRIPVEYYNMGANSIHTSEMVDNTFRVCLEVVDCMATRIDELYSGRKNAELDHEKLPQVVEDLCNFMNADVQTRELDDCTELKAAAFTDQVNTTVLDLLDVVRDLARSIAIIEPGNFLLILPRKMIKYGTTVDLRKTLGSGQSSFNGSRSDLASRNGGRSMMPSDEAYLMFMESTTSWDRAGIWMSERLLALRSSRHVKYAIKFAVVMGLLALPAYISDWREWYEHHRCQLAMISAMVAMETTRGMTFRTAGMKLVGAASGGASAFIVMEISQGIIPISIALTSIVGLIIGYLVLHKKWAKSGTVMALAYNLILGVATVFPDQGPISAAFARRLLTLPVGLAVATFVHLTLFPYHSRAELVKGLCSSLDWMHHLLFAIEASEEHPSLQAKFDAMSQKAVQRVTFAASLLPATHYEISLGGHWPYERFTRIVDKITDVMNLIVGEVPADPVLAFHLDSTRTCSRLRAKLLASLCNDLLVVSHTLSARLFLPRHESMSAAVLVEYQNSLLAAAHGGHQRSYCDVGRLADLVSEIAFLRGEVDELTMETQCPKKGLLPHLSFVVRSKSGQNTPALRSAAVSFVGDEEAGQRRDIEVAERRLGEMERPERAVSERAVVFLEPPVGDERV